MAPRIALAAAVLLLLGAVVFALWPTARRGGFTQILSTRRSDALGAKALYRVLERAGVSPRRWTEDLESLEMRGVLFALEPEAPRPPLEGLPRMPTFGKFERAEVLRWVEAGGRLVVVGSRTTGLHRDFGVRVIDEEPPRRRAPRASTDPLRNLERALEELRRGGGGSTIAAGTEAVATGASPLLDGARRLEGFPRLHHLDVPASDPRTLFAHGGRAVAAVVPRGAGLAVFVASPFAASNAGLARGDNLRFFWTLATVLRGDGDVVFDEYHHGERRPRGLMALAGAYQLHFAVGQLAFAALLGAWSAQRLRRRDAAPERTWRHAGEHLQAMAALYERGGLASFVAGQLWSATLATLASRLRLRGPRSARAVAAALAGRGREDLAAAVRALDARASALDRIRERDLVSFARELAEVRLALEPRASHLFTREIRR